MRAALALCVLVLLGGCAMQPPAATDSGDRAGAAANHPRYAPPPGVASQWRPTLMVYQIQGTADLYYRERVYYRFVRGWQSATRLAGPWQAIDRNQVPPNLLRHYPTD